MEPPAARAVLPCAVLRRAETGRMIIGSYIDAKTGCEVKIYPAGYSTLEPTKRKRWKPKKPTCSPATLKHVDWNGESMKRLPDNDRQWSKYRFGTRLRRNPTWAEKHLKYHLKKHYGRKNVWFQPVVFGYIPDFYFPSVKLAVEVDGGIHNTEEAKHYDAKREQHLNDCGITVVRFTNRECLNKTATVLHKLDKTIKELGGKFLRDAFNTNHQSNLDSRKRDTRGEPIGKPSAQGSGVAG